MLDQLVFIDGRLFQLLQQVPGAVGGIAVHGGLPAVHLAGF
ncbi:hypothetical protein [Acrocarpospora catenulata]|nr:hypothetical protein [Acrocarpospora catenulata]